MTEIAEKRLDLVKKLRCLLMSAPAALTVGELKRDYNDIVGGPIPFRNLGYTTIEDMLKDMQDSFQITWRNGVMCIQAIAQAESVHIQRLVSKQKRNNAKWATLRPHGPRRGYAYASKQPPPRFSQPTKSYKPIVPGLIRNQIQVLLQSFSHGVPLTHFDTAFSHRFGFQICYRKLGFSRMEDLLESIPDIVKIKEFQGGEWRVMSTAMVESVRTKQEAGSAGDNNQNNSRLSESYVQEQKVEKSENPKFEENSQLYAKKLFPEETKCETAARTFVETPRSKGRGRRRSGVSDERRAVGSVGQTSPSTSGSVSFGHNSNDSFDNDLMGDSCISLSIKKRLKEILLDYPDGIWANSLPAEYKRRFGEELSFSDQGYWSLVEMCAALPDIVTVERPSSEGDWKLYDAHQPHTVQHMEPGKKESTHTGKLKIVPYVIQEKVRQVLQCKPDGVLLEGFLSLYEELAGETLLFQNYGFSKLENFLSALSDEVLQVKYASDGKVLVCVKDTGKPWKTDMLVKIPEQEEKIVNIGIPSDAILPKVYYRPQELPPLFEFIEVYVSNINTPGAFWIQLGGKSTSKALDKLMNELEKVYDSILGDQYRVPDYLLLVGQIVVAVFPEDNNWHRCVITSVQMHNCVEVYFVDFGNTCVVHRNQIRLMKSKFIKLPAQAIQARLANIQPIGGQWTQKAKSRLLTLVMNRPLVAFCTFEKDRELSMCLIDTSTSKDICFNDVLVNEGLAVAIADDANTLFGLSANGSDEIPYFTEIMGEDHIPRLESKDQPVDTTCTTKDTKSEENSKRYILPIQLTDDYIVNLINLEGKAYLHSAEISSFFWDMDILTAMLEQVGASANCRKVREMECPGLFMEMFQYGMIKDTENGKRPHTLFLYELESVPNILHLFNHESAELVENTTELITMFDPDDGYWNGEQLEEEEEENVKSKEDTENEAGSKKEEAVAEQTEDEDLEPMDEEDIQLGIQLLQFKRKRLLNHLVANDKEDCTVVYLDQLKEIESQISGLKSLLTSLNPKTKDGTPKKAEKIKDDCLEKAENAKDDIPKKVQSAKPESDLREQDCAAVPTVSSTSLFSIPPVKTNIVAPIMSTLVTVSPAVSAIQSTAAQSFSSLLQEPLWHPSFVSKAVGNSAQGLQCSYRQPFASNTVTPRMTPIVHSGVGTRAQMGHSLFEPPSRMMMPPLASNFNLNMNHGAQGPLGPSNLLRTPRASVPPFMQQLGSNLNLPQHNFNQVPYQQGLHTSLPSPSVGNISANQQMPFLLQNPGIIPGMSILGMPPLNMPARGLNTPVNSGHNAQLLHSSVTLAANSNELLPELLPLLESLSLTK